MKRGAWLLAAAPLLLVLSAGAQPPSKELSLAEASARALARNHQIAIENESTIAAAASLDGAEGGYDPALHVEARYRDRTDAVNSVLSGAPRGELGPTTRGGSASAGITQLLPTGGTVGVFATAARDTTNNIFAILSPGYSTSLGIDLRQPLLQNREIDPVRRAIRVAQTDRDRSEASLRRTVTQTIAAVENAYWTLVAARRDVLVRRQNVAFAEEQKSDTRARIDAGTTPESDIAQPVAEIERRKGELYAAEENARRAELVLASLILDDPADPLWSASILPTDSPETAAVKISVDEALRLAAEKRPELAEAAALIAREDVDVLAARDRVKPRLDLVASYNGRGLAGSMNPNVVPIGDQPATLPPELEGDFGRSYGTLFENTFPDASIGLAFSVPLGNRAAKADLVVAEALRRQSALLESQTRQRISAEVRNALNALVTSEQRIEAARAGRAAAVTQLDAEKERFSVGMTTSFFVLTRQNDLAIAHLTETAALTDYRKALVEAQRAIGTLLDERGIRFEAPRTEEETSSLSPKAPASRARGGAR